MGEAHVGRTTGSGDWWWALFVAVASLGLSQAFACAMPFAAVAVLAARTLPRRRAVALVCAVWSGHQAIGFGLTHYPHTPSTVAWGVAIGVAALTALGVAWTIDRRTKLDGVAPVAFALVVAYAAYEAVLLAAAGVLPSGAGAFAPAVVLRLLGVNAVALGPMLAIDRLARAAGLPVGRAVAVARG